MRGAYECGMIRHSLALLLAALTTAATAQTPLPDDQAAMKAHVMFLASDAMRGREAGSPEYDIAAEYVAAQFFAAGLKPAGDASKDGATYLQDVPLVTYAAAGEGAFTWTPANGAAQRLVFGKDYLPAPDPARAATAATAPVVFVGHGIRSPQYGHDDYRGVDVRGKIVAYVGGAPARFGGEERAFFGSPRIKAETAAARGAVGIVLIAAPKSTPADLERLAAGYRNPRITWAKADGAGKADAAIPTLGTLFPAGAAKLFAGAWAKVAAEAAKDAPRYRSAALGGTLSAATTTELSKARSSNVAGMIPGSDPVVGREVVVLSAHLDHIGVSKAGDGDRINNGAMDNAVGIASLIEEAKRFKASGAAPKRSILFLAVTAEEKGLIGSDYFANNPTVPATDIIANVNLDMPLLTYVFEDMVVFGAERSTLGPIVRRAVNAVGVSLSPDPIPEQGIFVRSDHFRFVQKGIPSVFLWPGAKGAGEGKLAAFLAGCYHKPCDDLTQPIRWDQGVRFVDVNYRIAREIADAPARPVWNKGDYFGTLYKGPMAK